VSIGIPTYNRAEQLAHAIASALGQTHKQLEIVIGDNASSDTTPEVCAQAEASDPRVRVIRRAANVGPIGNFDVLLAELRGEYVMLLADDDALQADFVERCLTSFAEQPGLAMVQGRTRYVRDGVEAFGHDFDVTGSDPVRRVGRYLSRVYDNGAFYGLMRRDVVRAALPMPNMLGGDWAWVARLVFQGGLQVRHDTTLVRSCGGASTSFERIAEANGLSGAAAHPLARIVAGMHRDIATESAVYAELGPLGRHVFAARVTIAVLRARGIDLAWDELRPVAERPVFARAWVPFRDGFRRVRPRRPLAMHQCEREPSRRGGR
jgi:glycosyltransferase involved in cell wall biosynthesis